MIKTIKTGITGNDSEWQDNPAKYPVTHTSAFLVLDEIISPKHGHKKLFESRERISTKFETFSLRRIGFCEVRPSQKVLKLSPSCHDHFIPTRKKNL